MSRESLSKRKGDRTTDPSSDREIGLEQVRNAVKAIGFGEVRVIIQDGIIIQIDRIEKQRLR